MGLVLDEPTDTDEVIHEDGFDIVVDKIILDRTGGLHINARVNPWIGTEIVVTPNRVVDGICRPKI